MSMNDPLGDMLSRIRNAQMRNKSKVSTPGSKMRARVLEVLKTEGYIRGYVARRAQGRALGVRDRAEIFRRRAGDPRDRARVAAGPARLCLGEGDAAREQRPRHVDPVDPEGRDGGSRGARRRMSAAKSSARCSKAGRRNSHVSHRKKVGAMPSGVTAKVEGQTVKVKGPKGELRSCCPTTSRSRWTRRRQGRSAQRDQAGALACGAPRARW